MEEIPDTIKNNANVHVLYFDEKMSWGYFRQMMKKLSNKCIKIFDKQCMDWIKIKKANKNEI